MATPSRSPPLAAGSQAQHAAASSSSRPLHPAVAPATSSSLVLARPLAPRSLPPAAAPCCPRSPPLTAAVLEAAPNSSRSLTPAAAAPTSYSVLLARSLAAQAQQIAVPMTWALLGRILDTSFAAEDGVAGLGLDTNFVAEDGVAGAEAQADAQQAAADISFMLAPPPRVTVVSAGRSAHPDPGTPDACLYIISAAPYCILVHFAEAPTASHLVALRNFHTTEGQTTATAERVGDRSSFAPIIMNLSSIVVCANDSEYSIYELQVQQGVSSARLISVRSGTGNWEWKDMLCPLPAGDRVWVPHGAVADDHQNLYWFDLSWGVISFDASSNAKDPELLFHLLPEDRHMVEATPGISNHRTICVSKNELRYVDIIPEGLSARVYMWTLRCISGEWKWERTYTLRFSEIWNDDSYKNTKLPRNIPVLVVVCPSDPELVYFSLEHSLFGVNIPDHKVFQMEAYQFVDMPWPTPTPSNRHLIAWVLPTTVAEEPNPMEPSEFPLSIELIGVITSLLQCPASRFFISMVCRGWRAETLLVKPLPKYLPSLLLPHHSFGTLSLNETERDGKSSMICLTCCAAHPVRRPVLLFGERFIGSYDGGWVFTAYQDQYHSLVNMHNIGEQIHLPDEMTVLGWLRVRIILRAATLSAPPNMHGCIGAPIVSTSWSRNIPGEYAVFWRIGNRIISCMKAVTADDILYIGDSFYILLKNGDLTVCTPQPEEIISLDRLEIQMKDLHFRDVEDNADDVYLSRYLVDWQGDIFMVVRSRRLAGTTRSLSSFSFQVFRMALLKEENDQSEKHGEYFWERVDSVHGLIIILGRGCSRCYSASTFPSIPSGIYFHDEDFNCADMVWNEDGEAREYPVNDNGVCTELPDCVERLLPELVPSAYSSPIWFLH